MHFGNIALFTGCGMLRCVINPYSMSPWIRFEVYGLHNGYIRDDCPKNFQWPGNFLGNC